MSSHPYHPLCACGGADQEGPYQTNGLWEWAREGGGHLESVLRVMRSTSLEEQEQESGREAIKSEMQCRPRPPLERNCTADWRSGVGGVQGGEGNMRNGGQRQGETQGQR